MLRCRPFFLPAQQHVSTMSMVAPCPFLARHVLHRLSQTEPNHGRLCASQTETVDDAVDVDWLIGGGKLNKFCTA